MIVTVRRTRAVTVFAALALVGLAACGDSGSKSASVPTTAVGPCRVDVGSSKTSERQPVCVQGTALPQATDNPSTDPAIGLQIPTVGGSAFDGSPVTIGPDPKPQLLIFAAHWCPHCQREIPVITQWIASGGLPKDIQLTLVATGTNPDFPNYPPSKWLQKEKWPEPVLVDNENSDAATAFGLNAYPYFVFVNANGTVAARTSGELTVDVINTALSALKR